MERTFNTIEDYFISIGQPKDKYVILNEMYAIEHPKLIDGRYDDNFPFLVVLNKEKNGTLSLGHYTKKLKFKSFIQFYENKVLPIGDFTVGDYGGSHGVSIDPNDPKYKKCKIHDNREYKNLYKGLYDLVKNK